MTIKFEQTIDDAIAFLVHYQFDTARSKVRIFIYAAVMLLVIGMNLYNTKIDLNTSSFTLLFPMIFALCILIFFRSRWYYKMRLKASYRKQGLHLFVGERTLTLQENGLDVKAPLTDAAFKWSLFEGLKENKTHLFLLMSASQAIVIPKRIFLLPQEEYDVRSFIEKKLAEHGKQV